MKKQILLFITILFISFMTTGLSAQQLSQEDKERYLSYLNLQNTDPVLSALKQLTEANITEAIPVILNNFWRYPMDERFWSLRALLKLKYSGVHQLAIAYYDSIDTYKGKLFGTKLEYQMEGNHILFALGDYSKKQYVYDCLNNTQVNSIGDGEILLLENIGQNIPTDKNIVKDFLINIALNHDFRLTRWIAISTLDDVCGLDAIETSIKFFETDSSANNRGNVAYYILPKYRDERIHTSITKRASEEKDTKVFADIAEMLLTNYGSLDDYKIVSLLNPLITDTISHDYIQHVLIDTFYVQRPTGALPNILDTLISYNAKCTSYNWLGNTTFSDQLKTYLTEAKIKLASGDSLGAALKIKLYQNQIAEQYKDTVTTDGKFVTGDGYKFLYYYPKYILERLPKLPTVRFNDSQGKVINGGSLQYYENGWKDAINNNDGTFSVPTTQKNISLKMNYAYGSQTKSNVSVGADTIIFQTANTLVKLLDSKEAILDTGRVQYYSNGWRDFGMTAGGTVSKELLPGTYTFKMSYAFASIDKQQNIETNPVVEFRTKAVNVKLNNSLGNPLDVGTVQYYSNGWRNFGLTTNGVAVKELLPVNYTFKMNYSFASIDKQQNVSANPVVEFSTALVNVKLNNSLGEPLDVGTVQYYSNGWRDFGTTTNGTSVKELLPVNYTFKMNYGFASIDKQQNVSTNPVVEFSTALVNVKLNNSLGEPLDVGTVQYYSNGWRDFGTTTNGTAVKELLPVNYTFKMNYGFASIDKQQNVSTNPVVEFQTTKAHVELRNSLNQLMPAPMGDLGTVQYYSNGWRDFGTTVNGITEKELLPVNYTFKMNFGFASLDKLQNLSQNNSVVFQTVNALVQLKDSQGNPLDGGTVEYYSNGWRSFGTTESGNVQKELLPASYTFRITHAFVSNDKVQVIGTNNTITFSTTLCSINVKDAQNQPVNNSSVSYYSNGWRAIGATVNGLITKELLPANLTFRAVSGSKQLDKTQNIGTNNNVEINLP